MTTDSPKGPESEARPKIVCISGSMRFEEQMRAAAVDLSLEGAIVTGPFVNMKKSDPRWADELADPIKVALDELHFRKIDLADEVLVVAPGGYVGDSTRREMSYASKHGKPIRFHFGRDVAKGSTAASYLIDLILNGQCVCVGLCGGDAGGCGLCSVLDPEWPCPNLDENDYPAAWCASSSEAPQPQEAVRHKVRVEPYRSIAFAACVTGGCGQHCLGTREQAEDWKDQHEADTLRPVGLTNESFISQQVDDAVLFAVAQDRVRRDKGERHTLEDVAAELELMDEGRPPGSNAAAPHSDLKPGDHVRWNGDTGWFEGVITKATDPRAVMWMEKWDVQVTDGGTFYTADKPGPRDGVAHVEEQALTLLSRPKDAVSAARSEATPKVWRDIRGCEWEEDAPHDELRLIRTEPSHSREINGPTFSRRYVQAHYGPLTEVPSPSLRKEGEDRPSPPVSTQEETKGETDE